MINCLTYMAFPLHAATATGKTYANVEINVGYLNVFIQKNHTEMLYIRKITSDGDVGRCIDDVQSFLFKCLHVNQKLLLLWV